MTGFLFKKTAVAGVGYRQYPRGTAALPERGVLVRAIIDACDDASYPMATITTNRSG